MNVIIPTTIESVASDIQTYKASIAQRLADTANISNLITRDIELTQLKEQVATIDEITAEAMMNKFIKLGTIAEKASIYQEALKEYKKALFIAWKFEFKDMAEKISNMNKEIEKKIYQMEIDFNINAAEKAEKKKDYIESIRNYQAAIDILEKQLNSKDASSKIKKLKKHLEKLQGIEI